MGSRPRLLSQQPLNVQRALPQWARIGSVAGAAADAFYTDAAGIKWRYVQWNASNASGLVIAVPGLVECLCCGGGGGGSTTIGSKAGGGGGGVRHGMVLLPSGTIPITVGTGGAAGAPTGVNGGDSSLGSYMVAGGGCRGIASNGGSYAPGARGGAGGVNSAWGTGAGDDVDPVVGFYSSITGASVEYGTAADRADRTLPGAGGRYNQGEAGTAGVVIVRVPA